MSEYYAFETVRESDLNPVNGYGNSSSQGLSIGIIVLIVLGCFCGLILLAIGLCLLYCWLRNLCQRHGLDFNSIKQMVQSRENVDSEQQMTNQIFPGVPYYQPSQFEHKGPLQLPSKGKVEDIGDAMPIEADKNPQNAHFSFTDGKGNVVYDIGSDVERVVD